MLSALFLAWPMRMLALAIVLGLAFVLIMSGEGKPLQGGRLIASWFILGYGLFSALFAILDMVFPPLD